ncbi:MAG: efflux RND transporter permease subunit, partial [Oscillospiraceae bacterium]|nr:efflux RND transporter permease subunit [Oscillospiraceae bacterium]
VNNGIILVDYTSLLVDRGRVLKDACLEAGASRLRPVLMTTLTTVLGMLPMCFTSSNGSASMVQPIGVAVVGGLTSSTFVTLFFIPVLYSLVMKPKNAKQSRIQLALTQVKAKAAPVATAAQAAPVATAAPAVAATATTAAAEPATESSAPSALVEPAADDGKDGE